MSVITKHANSLILGEKSIENITSFVYIGGLMEEARYRRLQRRIDRVQSV